MEKNLVFFKKEGDEGVALTSTSANHIANLAKEYIQSVETQLSNIKFFGIEVALVGSSVSNTIQIGSNNEALQSVQSMLDEVAKAKSLMAWLREGIKAKEELLKDLQKMGVEDYCKENNIEYPDAPERGHVLTEEEYYDSLSIKERNRYYQLQTKAAVIGDYIHPNGTFHNARKALKDKMQHPHQVDGKGRDSLIYTYTPSVQSDDVDAIFFELQKEHRETQAQLNAMKYNCEQAINESTNKVNTDYSIDVKEYRVKIQSLSSSFKTWKDVKSQEYSKLKIIVPNSLLEIYNIVNSLGK